MSLASLSPVLSVFLLSLVPLCSSDEQLTPARPLVFPDDELISNNGVFALGFFSPTNSSRSVYIGIWYNNIPERLVVWVANRDNPITNPSSATLKVTNQSDLVLSDHEGRVYWTTANNITTITMGTAGEVPASATLVNEGNLVLRSWNSTILWQSFDHPTDTLLPDMPLRMNYRTRFTQHLVSWKGPDNPSIGNFSLGGDVSSGIQIFIWEGSNVSWRSAAWSGGMVSSFKPLNTPTVIVSTIVTNGDDISVMYSVSDGPPGIHARMAHTGKYEYTVWNTAASAWSVLQAYPGDGCDHYATCGPFSYCDYTAEPVWTCKCPDGFEPNGTKPSAGCARKEPLRCGREDHFVTLQNMKTPAMPVFVRNRSFEGCTAECLSNCLCTAYAYSNLTSPISGGDLSRCLLWFGELVDMGKQVSIDGENLYLRLAGLSVQKKSNLLKIVLPTVACLMLFAIGALVLTCKSRAGKRQKKKVQKRMVLEYLTTDEAEDKNFEFPFISYGNIITATDNFSDQNMLGQGGFGKVYKGLLEGTKEVAVKRLSKYSGQGNEEFRNEVVLIAKLQHKNLVRLLGCCIHEDEKLLVYEYLPNKSLNYFLFDSARKLCFSGRQGSR